MRLHQGPAGVTPALDANWRLISVPAGSGSSVIGTKMLDGAFKGSNANFNYKPDKAEIIKDFDGEIDDVDVDAFSMGLWSLLAGLFSVLGLRRFVSHKAKQQ